MSPLCLESDPKTNNIFTEWVRALTRGSYGVQLIHRQCSIKVSASKTMNLRHLTILQHKQYKPDTRSLGPTR